MLDYNDRMNKSIHFFHWNINILHMSIVKIIAAKNFARSAARSHLSSAFCLKIGVKFFCWKIEKFQKIKNFQKNRNIPRNRKIAKNRKFPIISGPSRADVTKMIKYGQLVGLMGPYASELLTFMIQSNQNGVLVHKWKPGGPH